MKYLTTLFCMFYAILAFSQSSFIHIESQHLQKRSTEYYGSLADKPDNDKVDDDAFMNYNPVITFNGNDDHLKVKQEIPDASQMTIFTVFMPSENSMEEFDIWSMQAEDSHVSMTNTIAKNTSNQLNYTGIQNGKPAIHCYTQYYAAGTENYTDGSSFVALGKNEQQSNSLFKGAIAELIAYDRVLTATDRTKIISSLAIKYGISLANEQNYIGSDKQVIWDAQNDNDFSHNITGIGRDDELKLYQKQSTSSNEPNFLVIGVDAIHQTDELNEGTLQDQYYMLWGDNNQTLKQSSTELIENSVPVLERKWLMNVTGNTEDDINTQVKIDAATMLNDSIASYLLMIDESGQGDFTKQHTRFLYPSSISENGIITYDNVQWDQDGSGKDVFSFRIDDRHELPEINEEWDLDENSSIDQYTVYPTLSEDGNYKIYVQLERIKDISIKVFDMSGKLISNNDLRNQNAYFIEGVPIKTAGMYNIALYTNQEKLTKKIVVKN